jgi:hypothetical protein
MVQLLLAAVLAVANPGQGHLGTAVTATFTNHATHGVACVVGGRCHRIKR